MTRAERWSHGVLAIGLVIQAGSGFVGDVLHGSVAGWWLIAHVCGAPLFLIGLVATALLWAERCAGREVSRLNAAQRVHFWVLLGLGFAVAASMLAAMTPWFGYAAQRVLIRIHETSAIALLLAIVPHTVVSATTRRRKA